MTLTPKPERGYTWGMDFLVVIRNNSDRFYVTGKSRSDPPGAGCPGATDIAHEFVTRINTE